MVAQQNPTPLLPSARPQRSPAQGSTQPRQRAGLATPRLLRFRSAASRAALTPAACLPGPLRRSPAEPATFFPERTWRSLASLESGTRDFLYPFLHFPCVIKINVLRWHVIVPSRRKSLGQCKASQGKVANQSRWERPAGCSCKLLLQDDAISAHEIEHRIASHLISRADP